MSALDGQSGDSVAGDGQAHRVDGMDVIDARGKRVRMLDPVVIHLLRRRQLIPSDELHTIAREIDSHWSRAHVMPVFVAVAIGMLLCLYYIHFSGKLSVSLRILLSANIVFPMVIPWWAWRRARKLSRLRIVPVLLRHGRCAHCAYDLHGLHADASDGATVCPECGCAWRLDDVAADLPISTAATKAAERKRLDLVAIAVIAALAGVWAFVLLLF
ncbi:MAG: hypothetical protein H6817_09860 [Phycisphaerales bacterium]|nr:hypothetical protein [Phycisphaerales bacterium]